MKQIEGYFTGARGAEIYYQGWLPEGEVRAVLFIVHGLGEHCGRYMNAVNHFVPLGCAVYGLDHVGHGKSSGVRLFAERFYDYTDTLNIFYEMVKGWQPEKPVYFLGHSMGGLIAAYYLPYNQNKFQGAIISAPLIMVGASVSPVTIFFARLLSALAPKVRLQAINAALISRDPEVVKAYVTDPRVYNIKVTARLAAELLTALLRASTELDKISLPFIVVQGSEDKLVDPRGAQLLYDQASSQDKTIKVYQGWYHEVMNEPGRAQVFKDMEEWLLKRL